MFGLLKGLFKLGLVGIVGVGGAGSYGYYRYAASKLPAPAGTVISGGVCRPTPSLSGATLPLTFEAKTKDGAGHNWLDGGAMGLVSGRWEWSHGSQAWVRDQAFEERQAAEVAERKRFARRVVDDLIADLADDDPIRREIAAKELFIRTGETRGYRYDAPAAERDRAVEAWKAWWADDRNKARYGAKRAIDMGQKVLDTLKRALGEPEESASEPPALPAPSDRPAPR